MTIPHKIYSTTLSEFSILAAWYLSGSFGEYDAEFTINGIALAAGLDEMIRAELTYDARHWMYNLAPAHDHMEINWAILPNHWNSYNMKEVAAGANSAGTMHFRAFITGAYPYVNKYQDDLIANGIKLHMTNFDPGAPDVNGEYLYYSITAPTIKVFFFNPIVNSISRLWAPTAGGVEVVLTGLGFDNPDSEIDTGGPPKAGGWTDAVDYIDFVGLQGQGTTILNRGLGDFTIDSNAQITIPSGKFPALASGTYHLNLRKVAVDLEAATTITGYAGDWACDSSGRVYGSTRITFLIDNSYADRPFRTRQAPILLTDWHLKDRSDGSEIMKYYSMDTIRCPDRIYTGSLSAISSIPRGFEDKTGLLKVTDITLDLANNTLEFSKLLDTQIILKDQIVKLYQAYPDEIFGWREHIISVIIDDYFFEDDIFKVKLKDITQKYFRLAVPREICTEDHQINATNDYSNIHPDSIGAFVPEVLGLCSLTSGEFRGQIEAICIDTVNFKYVAANGALNSIDQVYADDPVAVNPANYTISREEDGRTYITFTGDQEDKKVTFNCKGYSYGGMNSDNGYVQNPAYILLYFLLMILKIPPTMIDFSSFIAAATVFSNKGDDEAGKLILQDEQKPMDVTQDLMAGAKCYPRKDGRLAAGIKDMSNYQTNEGETAPIIFRQLDIVGKFERQYNMRDAITMISAEYDYVPTWDLFKSNVKQSGDVVIDPWDPHVIQDRLDARTIRRDRRRPRRDWAR